MTEKEYNKSVDLYSQALFRFLFKSLKVREEAENIVQDSFESLWLNREKVDAAKTKSWLFTTGYRKMIDLIRKEQKSEDLPEQIKEKGLQSVQPDLKKVIGEALKKLPEIQKTVVLLRDYEGYNYEEIGKITGLSDAQVRVYIFRARQTMKNYLVSLQYII